MATLELNSLRILKYKRYYDKYYEIVKDTITDDVTAAILASYKPYFELHPVDKLDVVEFTSFFLLTRCQSLDEDNRNTYIELISQITPDVSENVLEVYLTQLADKRLSDAVSDTLMRYQAGDDIDIRDSINEAMEEYDTVVASFEKQDYIEPDIDELIKREENDVGLHFPLKCLNYYMKPLNAGNFGIVAARPDAGKTTFVLQTVVQWCKDLPRDKNVLIFNNEGNGDGLFLRLYQAALGMSIQDVIKLHNKGKLIDEFERVVGRKDRIRIINVHDMKASQLDLLMKKHNAGAVVFDMLDNVNSFASQRTDERLEKLYQWGRSLQTKYGSVGLATSQVSADGEGLRFPFQSMLKDSKTGKQGACDFIIIIGKDKDDTMDSFRYIGVPKNKLKRQGRKGDPKAEVLFKPDIGQYIDAPEDAESTADNDKQ